MSHLESEQFGTCCAVWFEGGEIRSIVRIAELTVEGRREAIIEKNEGADSQI